MIGLCIVMGELYRCFDRAVQMLRLGLYDVWVSLYDDWVCLYDVFGVACMCFPPLSLWMKRACMVDLIVESGGFWEGDLR